MATTPLATCVALTASPKRVPGDPVNTVVGVVVIEDVSPPAGFWFGAGHVFGVRDGFEVVRVAAIPSSTRVIDFEIVVDGAVDKNVDESVGEVLPPPTASRSVPGLVFSTEPRPTEIFIVPSVDLRPDLFGCAGAACVVAGAPAEATGPTDDEATTLETTHTF